MNHEKKNIIFIFTDDQRFDMLSCYPNKDLKTSNLDMLAELGVHFINAHIPGGNNLAVCQPSGAMINSGRTLHGIEDHGQSIPESHIKMPEHLRHNGYMS